jgi:DNA-binding transcriptional regulator/RsmH inhibitor MraZ
MFFREENHMGNIKDRERLERLKSAIWKKRKVDEKGRTVLPKQLRQKLGLKDGSSKILWIQCNRREGKTNEFIIEVGVEP